MTSSAQNSKQVLSQKGSAATPGVSFQGDNDTGIFSSATNSMGIAAGGTKIVDVTPTGVNITGSLVPSTAVAVANGGTGSTTAAGARTNLSAASSGANSDITSITGLTTALTAPQGGTGFGTYAIGDILYASTTSALSKLADVATGNALISGGVGTAPSWGKIGLTTHVSGTLGVANGGTGQTTYTDGQLLIGNSTGNTLTKATLTAGANVTITNAGGSITIAATGGTAGVSSFSAGTTGLTPSTATTGAVTLAGTLAVANGGTGVTTSTGSGSNVLSTSPTLVTPVLGTPTSVTLTNGTGLPLSTGVTGLLPVANGGTGTATPNIVAGTNVTVSGTWPNQTINASGGGSSTVTISNKTSAYTVVSGDLATIINCTSGTFTVSLTAAASLASGFNCWVWNNGTGDITIDPAGSETIDGVTIIILRQGEGTQIVCNGTNWYTGSKKTMRGYAENLASNTVRPVAGTSTATAIGATSAGNGSVATNNGGAIALGGAYSSGFDSFAASIVNNTSSYGAQGGNSVALGCFAYASGSGAIAIGYQSTASGAASVVLGSGGDSGIGSTASGTRAVAIGDGAVAAQFGKYAYSAAAASAGDSQYGMLIVKASTTGSVVRMTSDGGGASAANQLVASTNKVMIVTGTLIGKQTGTGNIAAYTVTATVVNSGGTLTVPTGTLTLIGSDSIGLTTSPTLTADSTYNALAVTSGAKTATNIKWLCTLQATELTYA